MIMLFTDFGLHGPYTGQMKAVLHQMAPGIPVIDLFADAPVGNPKASAYLLAVYAEWFPAGTTFLCVVDPGVGGTRPSIIIEADGRWYVGPGNGLFELVQRRKDEVVAVLDSREVAEAKSEYLAAQVNFDLQKTLFERAHPLYRSPIVVFCSKGDNITPPQQALGWILQLYDDVDEIRLCGQTIVYSVHESVGHLGIFVSGGVARKQYGEFANNIDLIDVLPPGLYEAVFEEKSAETANPEFAPREWVMRCEVRTLDDSARSAETILRTTAGSRPWPGCWRPISRCIEPLRSRSFAHA